MNKRFFFVGIGIYGFEVLGFLAYFLTQISWDIEMIEKIIAFSVFSLLNIAALIFIIIGLVSKGENNG